MKHILILTLIFSQISGCVVQSNQYEFIKELISKEMGAKVPEKNWSALWMNDYIDLYAINVGSQIIFADNQLNITFENMQIKKVVGLLPNNSVIDIRLNNLEKSYFVDNDQVTTDECKKIQILVLDDRMKRYTQICFDAGTENSYKNEVIMNPNEQIVGMTFKVHPNYPLLKLSMK